MSITNVGLNISSYGGERTVPFVFAWLRLGTLVMPIDSHKRCM